jgi:hypothetical protein
MNHFTIIERNGSFIVQHKKSKVEVATYPDYLRAKIREAIGNRNIKTAKTEFGSKFGMESAR